MSMFSRGRSRAARTVSASVPAAGATQEAATADGNVIYVSSAQVKAAQLLVDLAEKRNEPVDPAVLAIAKATRTNGHRVASAESSSRPIVRSATPDPTPS